MNAALWTAGGAAILIGFMWFASAPRAAQITCGTASWYGAESGGTTASGQRFRPDGLSAASMSLPLGSRVIVRNVQNGRSVQLTINDRGPAPRLHRIIDLSRGAARVLGIAGLGRVCVEKVG